MEVVLDTKSMTMHGGTYNPPPPPERGEGGSRPKLKWYAWASKKVIVRIGMGGDQHSGGFRFSSPKLLHKEAVEGGVSIDQYHIFLFRDGNLHMVHGGRGRFQVINQKGNALVKIPVWAASFKPCRSNPNAAELKG